MRSRDPRRWLERHSGWLLVLVLFVGLGTLGRGDPPPPVPPPPGWQRIAEPGAVLAIVIDGETVWAGGRDGLHRLDRRTGRWLGRVAPRELGHVRALTLDDDGLWIGHLDGLARWDGRRLHAIAWPDDGPRRVNALCRTAERLLVGTPTGLLELRDGRLRRAPANDRLLSPVVAALFVDRDGGLWCGSSADADGGVTRFGPDRVQRWSVADGLPHPYINQLAQTRDGRVMVATGHGDYGGLAILEPGPAGWRITETIDVAGGLAGPKARSVWEDDDGHVWCGSENDGLAVFGARGPRVLTADDGLTHGEVTCLVPDGDGNLWLGTVAGVTWLTEAARRRVVEGKEPN